ncbi:hypothetical protein OUZ56_003541 [Daphnia magna]|uniref:Uncharacterized protein n=1 Tax=Daphnia magna TaxID=35525 RepID=A0ABR0A921_9CRUS|nr:hypothetical protein OUZ56_003541 [Daphnia magna]
MGYVTEMSGKQYVNRSSSTPPSSSTQGSRVLAPELRHPIGSRRVHPLAFRFSGLGSLLGLYIQCCRYFNPCSWLASPQFTRRDIEM